jgi:fumarate reductase flavoprotein subunit
MWQPEVVYVNLNGERWIDETESLTGSFFALGEQPGGEMWTIVDDNLLDIIGKRLLARGGEVELFKGLRDDIAYEVSLDESGVPGKHSRTADTPEGLAKKIGADPQTFVKTIETYNQYCDQKRNLDFAKKPEYLIPLRKGSFYAFWGQRFAETTHGGIVINENGEVLKSKGKKDVVPGLFCAGDASGGWTIDKPMPAISAGNWMVSSGYMASMAAAKHLGKA